MEFFAQAVEGTAAANVIVVGVQPVNADLKVYTIARPASESIGMPSQQRSVGQDGDTRVSAGKQAVDNRLDIGMHERLATGQRKHAAAERRRLACQIKNPSCGQFGRIVRRRREQAMRTGQIAAIRKVQPKLAQTVGGQHFGSATIVL